MRWHLETWRKLYVAKSPAWLRLPVSARGLGRELLTYCDDAGRIDIGEDAPGVAVAYLLGARPKEHKRIADDVQALLADGYLIHEGTDLRIRNFVEAQDRTPAAKRTAAWRARKDAGTSPGDGPGDVTGDVSRDASEQSPETTDVLAFRSVPTRSVPNRAEESARGSVEAGLGAALSAHRKLGGMDHQALARDLVEALVGVQMSTGRTKTLEEITQDVTGAVFELPEHPNEATARRKLRAFVVGGGWKGRSDGAPRVQGGVEELPRLLEANAKHRAERERQEAERIAAGGEDHL